MPVAEAVANAVLVQILQGASPTWVALHLAEPSLGAIPDHHEVVGVNYGRVLVTAAQWVDPSGGESSNEVDITFATAGDDWGLVTWVSIYGSETSDDIIIWGELNVPRGVTTGETLQFSIGSLISQVPIGSLP
jgi:hypothetical protein